MHAAHHPEAALAASLSAASMNKLIDTLCGWLAGLALMGIMVLTFFDVSGRKLLSNSITGSLELTELLMVAVIFAGLPLVSRKGEHVVFDSLDPYLPAGLRRLQRRAVSLLCAMCMGGLAALMWSTGGDFAATGETTAQLKIAKYPFIYGMSLLCALTALVHLAQVVSPLATAADEHEGGAL